MSQPPDENTPPPSSEPPSYGTPPPSYGTPSSGAAPQFGTPPPADQPPPAPPYGGPPQYGQPQYGQPPQYAATPTPQFGTPQQFAGAPLSVQDERMWSMLGHLGGIVLGFIAPLIVFLVYKDRSAFVRRQSAEALNFQITLLIGWVVATVLTIVLIGFLLYLVLFVANIVLCIVAGVAANKGEEYRYPATIRFVS